MPITVPGFAGGLFTIGGNSPPSPVGGGAWGTPVAAPAPAPAPGGLQGMLAKIGGVFGAPQAQTPSLFAGDPQEARRRALMAAGAQMLQASGPNTQRQNAGQILGQGMLAGQKASDEYRQDAQRQAYMQQLQEQQQFAMQQKKRALELEQKRAQTLAGAQVSPEVLEAKAGELYAAGDVAGADQLLEYSLKLRNHQVNAKNAETNAAIAARGQGQQYDFHNTPHGMYRVDPNTGKAERVASWDQFNPSTDKSVEKPLSPEEQRQKDALGRRIADSISFFSGQKGAVPAVANAWDRTVGRAFGSEGYQDRRNMDMIIKNQVLQMAKFLRPVSNDEVKFLLSTMPLESDPPDVQVRWLRQAAEVAGIQLPEDQGGSVAAEFGLERAPGKTPGATGSF